MGVVVFIPGQRSVKLVRSAALLLGSTGLPLGWFITRRWRRLQEVETILRSAIRDSDTQQNVSLFPCLHNVFSMHYTQNINKAQKEDRVAWFCFLLPCVSFFIHYLSNNVVDFSACMHSSFILSFFSPFYQSPNENPKPYLYFHSSSVCGLLTCLVLVFNSCRVLFLKYSHQNPTILMIIQECFKQVIPIHLTRIMVFY